MRTRHCSVSIRLSAGATASPPSLEAFSWTAVTCKKTCSKVLAVSVCDPFLTTPNSSMRRLKACLPIRNTLFGTTWPAHHIEYQSKSCRKSRKCFHITSASSESASAPPASSVDVDSFLYSASAGEAVAELQSLRKAASKRSSISYKARPSHQFLRAFQTESSTDQALNTAFFSNTSSTATLAVMISRASSSRTNRIRCSSRSSAPKARWCSWICPWPRSVANALCAPTERRSNVSEKASRAW